MESKDGIKSIVLEPLDHVFTSKQKEEISKRVLIYNQHNELDNNGHTFEVVTRILERAFIGGSNPEHRSRINS